MQQAFDLLPVGPMLAIMLFGVGVVLIACLPTLWVDRLIRFFRERFGERAGH